MSTHEINTLSLIAGCVICLVGIVATIMGIVYRKRVNPNTFNLPVAMGIAFILSGVFAISLANTPAPTAQEHVGKMQTDLSYLSSVQEYNRIFMESFRHELWRMYVDKQIDSTTYANWKSCSDSAYYAKDTEIYQKYTEQMKNDLPNLLKKS
jgi:hypothetical protein